MTDEPLPEKFYFKIGEVAAIAGVRPHVLRYWESEFPTLNPEKSKTNQRRYRRRDVDLVLRIKRMLYEEGLTIAGAQKRLSGRVKPPAAPEALPLFDTSATAHDSGLQIESGGRIRSSATAGGQDEGEALAARVAELESELAATRDRTKRLHGALREELTALRALAAAELAGANDNRDDGA